jgi:translation initiation factor IF-1
LLDGRSITARLASKMRRIWCWEENDRERIGP